MKIYTWNEYKELSNKGERFTPYNAEDENYILMLDGKCELVKVQLP